MDINKASMSDIAKGGEKIASAVYLITSFFKDQEPLKWQLRTLSMDLIADKIKDKFNIVREISALFSVAKSAGLISYNNYEILIKELAKFEDAIEKPLKLAFSQEVTETKEELSEPKTTEHLKDKITENQLVEKTALKNYGAVSVKKNTRQSIIIAVLKRKREVMIKDVAPLINGCSEKTIQRELLNMVHSGVIKKIGEKRWSRYSLA